jgi:hypothetical protein
VVPLLMNGAGSVAAVHSFLRIHPSNPHYFQDANTRRAVLLASHGAIVPTTTGKDSSSGKSLGNYTAQIQQLHQNGVSYARVWHFLPWDPDAMWPWQRAGEGGKLNLSVWNETYWARLTDSIATASALNITSEVMLFDRCGLTDGTAYSHNPWCGDCNINSLEMPPGSAGSGVPAFYQWAASPRLRYYQARYAERLVRETARYNVVYEVENEHMQSPANSSFGTHWGMFVKNLLKELRLDRLVTYSSITGDEESFYTSSAVDLVNKHLGKTGNSELAAASTYIGAHWQYKRPVNVDEMGNGVVDSLELRRICWTIVTSGGHFHIEDAADSAAPFRLVATMRRVLEAYGLIASLSSATPQPQMLAADTGAAHPCLSALPTVAVCYLANATAASVAMISLPGCSSYTVTWLSPTNGSAVGNPTTVRAAGAAVSLHVPATGDQDAILIVQATVMQSTVRSISSSGGGGAGGRSSTTSNSSSRNHLRYFGWYSLTDAADMKANAEQFNLAFELHDPESIIAAHSLGATVLVNVKHLFFETKSKPLVLKPGWNASWHAASARWAPFLKNGTVSGFWLGDELIFGGVSAATIEMVAARIKRALPQSIVWYNEAWTVFSNPEHYQLQMVPKSLDWISIDM